jgi:hypothetical protein
MITSFSKYTDILHTIYDLLVFVKVRALANPVTYRYCKESYWDLKLTCITVLNCRELSSNNTSENVNGIISRQQKAGLCWLFALRPKDVAKKSLDVVDCRSIIKIFFASFLGCFLIMVATALPTSTVNGNITKACYGSS